MTAGRLILDDGELTCQRRGDGPPVVLLHASGLSGALRDRRFPLPARDHTAVRYDARGHGGASPVAGPFARHEDLEESVPGAEKVVVEGAGHLVNHDRPDEFDRVLLRFLRASR